VSEQRAWNLVAELTYRCPLRCAYCSNPVDYSNVREGLAADDWGRVFREAAALGVVHVGLTGGEPSARQDLAEIVASATAAGLYTHLITAGLPITIDGLDALVGAGLRSVQLSIQDARPESSDRMAGVSVFERKLAFAQAVRARDLPLSLNVVLHRENIGRVDEHVELARRLGAHRLELANTQYYGWALLNRAALLPTREEIEEATRKAQAASRDSRGPEIVFALPDHHRDRPKPCMGGWGRRIVVVNPAGLVLPCHAAAELPDLEFYSVTEHSLATCWNEAPGMNAYRGEDWMQEPCRSCPEREHDFGGCRCQAFLLTGDASATDPACALAPEHGRMLSIRDEALHDAPELRYRGERARA
jgi:pyrroloquinoline quinone biosynthesis protein E